MSISSTFYGQILPQYFCAKKLQSQNVTREKLVKSLWYKKRARTMLMKVTTAGWSTAQSGEGVVRLQLGGGPMGCNIGKWSVRKPRFNHRSKLQV